MNNKLEEKSSDEDLKSIQQHKQMALNIGANFAQTIASEIYKQSIVANAAGLAAILAYVANAKEGAPGMLAIAAGFFLLGVGATLLGLMFTHTHTSHVLRKMLRSVIKGEEFRLRRVDRFTGFCGDFLGWVGVIAFCLGSAVGAYGLYESLIAKKNPNTKLETVLSVTEELNS